jgi:hypothetical protein
LQVLFFLTASCGSSFGSLTKKSLPRPLPLAGSLLPYRILWFFSSSLPRSLAGPPPPLQVLVFLTESCCSCLLPYQESLQGPPLPLQVLFFLTESWSSFFASWL